MSVTILNPHHSFCASSASSWDTSSSGSTSERGLGTGAAIDEESDQEGSGTRGEEGLRGERGSGSDSERQETDSGSGEDELEELEDVTDSGSGEGLGDGTGSGSGEDEGLGDRED